MDSSSCVWLNNPENNTNKQIVHKQHQTFAKVYDNVVDCIGNTPMIRLNNIPKSLGLKCEFLVKCEFLNPGGSVKDRIAQRMVEDAEKLDFIKPGCTLVEATSGNAGIGIAMVAAVKGYKMVAAMPEKISKEKENILRGLGVRIIRTPNEVRSSDPESHISMANKTRDETPGAVILDQYNNSSNPVAHYDHTGQEIVDQCGGKLDFLFGGVGTGGTMTGCASKIKELVPNCKCIGVDPQLSILAEGCVIGDAEHPSLLPEFVHVEGIGYDFIPNACVRSFIDAWVKTRDEESFEMARRLIREEGLLVGGSSGAILAAAVKYAKMYNLNENHRLVLIMPDSVRNYINKFLSDDWMIDKGFLPNEMYLDKESKLYGKTPKDLGLKPLDCFDKDLTVEKAFELLEKGAEVIPILEKKKVRGVLYPNKLMGGIQTKKLKNDSRIERCIDTEFATVKMDTDLSIVQKFLERHQVVLVQEKKDNDSDPTIYAINTRQLLKYYR